MRPRLEPSKAGKGAPAKRRGTVASMPGTTRVDSDTRDAEKQVERLLASLHVPVERTTTQENLVALGLGQRGQVLYRGFRRLVDRSMLVPAGALLRSLLDVTILVRWIEASPALHIQMWLGEDARQSRDGMSALVELNERRGRPLELEPGEVMELERLRDEARAAALAAHEPIRKTGSILPNGEQMMRAVPDLWEAYKVAYRVLSPLVHAGGRSFTGDRLDETEEGVFLRSGAPFGGAHLRSLAVPIVAMLVASVSRQCGLGLGKAADELRVDYTRWVDPEATATW